MSTIQAYRVDTDMYNSFIKKEKRNTITHKTITTKVYTLFQANFKVSYEARYNVTEFNVLKHMHISIENKRTDHY